MWSIQPSIYEKNPNELSEKMEEELDPKKLRALAEKRLEGRPIKDNSSVDEDELVAELTIHQEQLSIQN